MTLYERHFELLKSWNEEINLVSRKSIDKAFGAHYADSLWISEFSRQYAEGERAFDIGTGAGFPGILFAIRYPEIRVTLYEKSLKKQGFLSAALSQLALPNVVLEGGASEAPAAGLFLARAVFPPVELFKFMRKRMRPNSVLITNLGGKSEPLAVPGGFTKLGEKTYALPLDCGERRVEAFRYTPKGR